jgi:hypothetical protein
MYIVWGSKLMGKCDVVPGLFHTATKFGHIYYLPLIPTATYVVMQQSGKSFKGVPVPLSLKSILLAWARAALLVGGVVMACTALVVGLDKHPQNWVLPAVGAVLCLVACGVLSFARFATQASFERACQLAKELGLNEKGYEIISKAYGQAVPRAFAVQPAKPAMAAPPLQAPPSKAPAMNAPTRAMPIDDSGAIPLEPPPAPNRPQPGRIGL